MKKSITVVKIGYNSYAFEDTQLAMQFFSIISTAVQVTDSTYNLPDRYKHYAYCLSEDAEGAILKLVSPELICGEHTVKELREIEKSREDLEAQMNVQAAPLELTHAPVGPVPAPSDNDIPF